MNLREKLEKLNGDAERWDPENGEILIGDVKQIREIQTQYGQGEIAEIEAKDGVFTVFLSAVLSAKFIENEITEGDRVGIKYLGKTKGKSGKSYKNYAVVTGEDNGSEKESEKEASLTEAD